jgi:hypothetical protein
MLAARRRAVAGVPPSVNVTFVSSVFVNAYPVISPPSIADHTGEALRVPFPVCDRYFFVVVTLPASLAGAGVLFIQIISPNVVIGFTKFGKVDGGTVPCPGGTVAADCDELKV